MGTPVAAGSNAPTQVTGDCQTAQCDGQGGVVPVPDDTDLPPVTGACMASSCTNGQPAVFYSQAGTTCGAGLVCNDVGQCVGCIGPLECPGTDTQCQARTCINNMCGVAYTASGTKLSTQKAGDCQDVVCDGSGGTTSVADNNDKPNSRNVCIADACNAGVPSSTPKPSGTSCGTNMVCDGAGHCDNCNVPSDCPGTDTECETRTCTNHVCGVSFATSGTTCQTNEVCDGAGNCNACNVASDCPGSDTACGTRTCTNHVCGMNFVAAGTPTPIQTPGDCEDAVCDGAGHVTQVVDNSDLPTTSNVCLQAICTMGVPSNPPQPPDTSCGGSNLCDGSGNCVGCLVASDCGASNDCVTYTCNTGACDVAFTAAGTLTSSQTPGTCQDTVCNGRGGTQQAEDDTNTPASTSCATGVCTAGVPSTQPKGAGTSCGSGVECDGSGNCVQCLLASECPGTDTECQTRTCITGACGFNFTASGTPLSTQTPGDCQQVQCNGTGGTQSVADNSDVPNDNNVCTNDLCTAGVPGHTNVIAGTSCGATTECDGNGNCTTYCGNGIADGSEQCDGTDLRSKTCPLLGFTAGTLACKTDCTYDTSACTTCGNGVIETGEECDGANLGGATCQSLGFQKGTLACNGTCSFDVSGCSTCGDGIISGTEVCDGTNTGTTTCTSLGHAPGTLGCSAACDSFDTTPCDGGWILANTNFTGKVCVDGMRYGSPSQTPELVVCTEDNGIWRGFVQSGVPPVPLTDPLWAFANGTTVGQMVTSLLGRGVAVFIVNGKVWFWTRDASPALNLFGSNPSGFNANPPTWQTGNGNQASFAQTIYSVLPGSSNNNYLAGWDPVSGEAVALHGNTIATACTMNGGLGCSWPVLLGSGVTGTATSVVSGNANLNNTTFDIHVAVTGTKPDGTAGTGAGIYWSCDNGASYVEDDSGIAAADKPLLNVLAADTNTYGTHTARTCPTNSTMITIYATTMYAAVLGGASIYKTTDGGATWAPANTGLPAGVSVYSISIDIGGSSQLLYAATGVGVYKSSDGGAHWALDGMEGSVVRAVIMESKHAGAAIIASPNGATESGNVATFTTNGGTPPKVGDVISVQFVGVAGYNGIWTVSSVIPPNQFTVTLPTTGLAASGGGNFYRVKPRVFAATDQESVILQNNLP
jgi:hypothetical protein